MVYGEVAGPKGTGLKKTELRDPEATGVLRVRTWGL
jgi:hypothetical protein